MSQTSDRIYRLRGTPFEVGYTMGRALGPRLQANIERFVRARVPRGVPPHAERWRSEAVPWLQGLPARFGEEFEGLARGADLPLQRLAEWAYLEVILAGGCSGAIVTLDGRAWVARNNDFIAPDLWGYAAIREVTGRIPTITFGLEGDVFTSTGINRERLWLHYNYLPAFPGGDPSSQRHPTHDIARSAIWKSRLQERHPSRIGAPAPWATQGDRSAGDAERAGGAHRRVGSLPCYALMVEALETCCTLQDLEALLRSVPRNEAMLLFALDGKSDAYALYECTRSDFCVREPTAGWLVGTNHYVAHPQALQQGEEPRGPLSTGLRYRRMEALVADLVIQGTHASPPQELVRILADDEIEARGGGAVTTYANVACPSTGEVWHTFGGHPAASHGNWQALPWPW